MKVIQWIAVSLSLCATVLVATAAPSVGERAAHFEATDVHGKRVSLSDFKGKVVVLEWNNPQCPFVRKHYDSGNMQALQKRYGAEGVVWLAVNSTAQGSSEYVSPREVTEWLRTRNAAPFALLMDTDGKIGRAFDAKVTPHMFVIDPAGKLVYAGAIDDKRSTNVADVPGATNYVAAALTEVMAGRPVSKSSSVAYGCAIPYS